MALERLWRWSRRNRALASLAASTAVLLVLVAVVASAGYVRTTRANVEEARQRRKAEDTSALAVEALDHIFQQFAPDRTAPASSLLAVGDKGEEIAVPVQPVLSKEAAALLEHMLAFYDRLAAQGGDDAAIRRKVAEANRRVGDIRQRLGQYEKSEAAYLRAIDSYTALADASPENMELRTEIARIHNELGNVHWSAIEPQAAQACYRDALATLQAVSDESSPRYQYELARTYYFLGTRLDGQRGPPPLAPGGRRGPGGGPPGEGGGWKAEGGGSFGPPPGRPEPPGKGGGRKAEGGAGVGPPGFGPGPHHPMLGPPPPWVPFAREEGRRSLQKAIDLLERLVSEHAAVPDYRHLLARCYRELPPEPLGRDPQSAADTASKAAKILQTLVEEYPDVPDYRYDLSETCAWLSAREQFSPGPADPSAAGRSRAMLDKAMSISEELVAEHPNIPDYAVSQVHLRVRLADLLWESDPSRAEASLRKALEVQGTLVRRFPQTSFYKFGMAVIDESLANLLDQQKRLPEARSAWQDSIALMKEVLQEDPSAGHVRGVLAHDYMNLADLLRRMGETQAAEEAVRNAQKLRPD